jgi:peroxiredoxin
VRVAILVLAALLTLTPAVAAAPAAPGFKVRLLDGREVDSRDLIGKKILVLRFQASYCKPCARESAALARVADRYRARGVDVLAIHVQDTAVDARKFIRANKVTYPVGLDPTLVIGNRYGFKGTPYTVVIDRRGEVVSRVHGVSAVSRLPRVLDEILKGEPPAA